MRCVMVEQVNKTLDYRLANRADGERGRSGANDGGGVIFYEYW